MLINDMLFYPGKVNYNTFDIDFDKPLIEQLDELNEDLIQVEYKGDYLLDIGWCPERNENGRIIIQLVNAGEWDNPIVREECLDAESLLESIGKIMNIIDKGV